MKHEQVDIEALREDTELLVSVALTSIATSPDKSTPALLAALEKVWASVQPIEFFRHGARTEERIDIRNETVAPIRTILAPLFEKPEKTT